MNVRAKVRVENVESFDCYSNTGEPQKGASVTMRPVYDNAPENKTWAAATPSGQFQMSITNPPAAAFFKEGAELYVDFTPVA